jgi:hypothetical protein
LNFFKQKTVGRNKKGEDKVDEKANEEVDKKNAEIQLLTIKLKKMEREKQALNRRLAKAGLTDQDVAEEVEREAAEDEAKKTTQDESKENVENTEKGKDVEKIEAELKEIEVIKYKMQEDMIALRKDYEHQMEILNFKVNFNFKNLRRKYDNLDKGIKIMPDYP